jgi:hypothetical protein
VLSARVLVGVGDQAEIANHPASVQLEQVVGLDVAVRHAVGGQGCERGGDRGDGADGHGWVRVAAQRFTDRSRHRHHIPGHLTGVAGDMAIEQREDAGETWVRDQESDLVCEAAQTVTAARSPPSGENLDRPGPAVSGLHPPYFAVPAGTKALLPYDQPVTVSLPCADACHGVESSASRCLPASGTRRAHPLLSWRGGQSDPRSARSSLASPGR